MRSKIFLTTAIFALLQSTTASTCRTLTNSDFSTDTKFTFSISIGSSPLVFLENVNCPPSNTTCLLPRKTYDLTVPRTLNISVTPEDEEAIFALAREQYWNSTEAKRNGSSLAGNRSEEWVEREMRLDTRDGREFDESFFEVRGGLNYTLFLYPFSRMGRGTLGGCDNETLNGVGFRFTVPYEALNMANETVVAGTLFGTGDNTTDNDEGAGRRLGVGSGGLGLMAAMGLGTVLAVFL